MCQCRSSLDHPSERLELARSLMNGLPVQRTTDFMSAMSKSLAVCVLLVYQSRDRPSQSVDGKEDTVLILELVSPIMSVWPVSSFRFIVLIQANMRTLLDSTSQHADPFNI